jgi:hypothetical protein
MASTSSGYVLHAATVAGRSERAVAVTMRGWIVDSLLPNPGVILNLGAGSGQHPRICRLPMSCSSRRASVRLARRSHVRRIRRRLESFAPGGDEGDAD